MTASLSGCESSLKLDDVRKEQTLVLKYRGDKQVSSIEIRADGNVDGEALLLLLQNGKPYKSAKVEGKTTIVWVNDWYSDTAELVYKPTSVRSGNLAIEYHFHGL